MQCEKGTSLVKNSSQTVEIKDKTNEKKPYLEQNISNHKLDRWDKKANTNTSPEMKISCNVKKGTSLVKNSSQTVEIKDKTNEKKPYLEQNISNHKLDRWDKKANTNTSPEMKISCNVEKGTSLVKNSSQTVEIKDKTNEKKPYLEQNISNHKLDRWDKKANTNTSPEMKISCNVEKGTSLVKNSSQTVEIKDKTNEKKPYLEQNISNHKLDRWDKKANTNTSPEMKISCNVKQGTSLVKNSSQTVEIKDKTNEKKPYLEQNISNHKLDRWDKKANTNTSPEMKISCNVEKGTSLVKNSSQTVEIKDKTNEKKPYLEQNISNHKLDRWDKKANTNTSPEMKISCNVEKGTSLVKNSSQTVEIKDKTNEKKPYLEQNISNHKLDRWDKKANTNTSPEMKISCNVKQGTSLVKNSSQTVEIKDKTNEKKPYLEQNISNHKLDRWDKKANTNTSPEMKISCNVEKGTSLVKNSSQTVEIKDKTNEKKPYLEQNISNHKLDRWDKKANTNTSPEMKISCNVEKGTSLVKNSSQTVEIKDKTNEKKPYLEQNISNHKLDRWDKKANTNTSPEMKISCNVEKGTSLVKNSSQTVEIKDKTNEKKPYLEQNISNHKLDRWDKKANTNTSPEMKISCNVKQGTSLVKNSSQTVEIKDKTNEKKPYLEQNISNHKLDRWDKKANTNTSPEMKISCNVEKGTSLVKNSSQTVEIKDKTNEKKPYLEQNISNHKLDRWDKKANTNTSPEMKISCNVKQGTSLVKNSSQTVEIKDKTNEKKPYLEQNISNHKLDRWDKKANTNTSPEMKISCNVEKGTSLVKNSSQTVEIKDKTNEKKPYLEQNISNHKLDRWDKKANTNTSPEMKISCNVEKGTSLVKNSSQTVEIKDKTNEKKPYLEQNISNHKLDRWDKKANTNTSPEMKISCNVEKGTSLVKNSSQTVEIKDKTNEKKPYLEQNISNHKLDRWDKKANTNTSPEMKISCNVEKGTSLVKNSSQTVEIKDKTNEKKPYLEQNISNHKLDRWDKKANTNTSPEMKISCNVEKGTSLVKNSSQTVEIKDKTNEKKPYLEQNISNHKLDRWDKKANTNTSPEMKISCNVKQGTSLVKNSSQTVEIKDKTNEKKPYLEQNISNHKLDRWDKKANTNTSPEMKISCNVEKGTSLVKNSSQTVEIKDKTNEKKPYLEQNISNHKLDRWDKKANTNTSPEMKISCNVEKGTSLVKNSSQTVEIKDKTNEKKPYLEQNISNHKLDRWDKKANTNTSPEMKISCNVEKGTSLVKNSSQTVEIKDKTNEKKPYLEQNISNHKLDRWDKKANTNTSPEMKISCNVKQGTSLVKNSSQTVEIKDKTNEKKPYLEQNISNHKLDRWDKKANTNTSPEMKISCNVEKGTSLVKNSSQTVEIKDKTNEKKPYLEQNISNHKLDRWDKKANTNTSPEMKISCNVEKGTSLVKNSSQTVEIKDKTNEKKPYLEQNISNHKLDRWDKKANTNTSPEMKISCNVEKGTSLVKNSSQTVEIKDKTNEKKPYLEQNISNHKLDRWDKKANTNTSPEMKISCNVEKGTSLVKNSSQTVEIKDKTNEKKPYLEQNISNHKLDRWDKKANTNTSPEMKISCNVEKGTSLVKNSSQTVEIKDKTNEKKPYLEQNISNHKLDRWDKKANTNTSPEMKISCNVEKGTSLVKNSSQTVEIKDKTNEKKPYLEQNISNHKLDRWDKKANTNTSPEMKISCNVEKGTSLVKNSSQTVEIKDKTNEKKPYLEQNISNHKLDRWDKKANTNTSPEMKISCNVKQGTSLVKNSSQTVEIKDKTNEKKPYLEQNISNHKLDRWDKKANTNTSPEMKISCNVEKGTSLVKNSSQTVEIKDKTNEKKPYLEQNISNHKLDRWDKKANTNTSPEMKISCNVEKGTSLVKNSSQTVEIKDKTNEKKPYLEQNISNHKLDRWDKKANTNTSPEMKISCNVEKGTSLVKNSSQTVEIKDKTNEKKPYLEQNISNHKLDRWDKKANTNTSPEMKISCNVKQGTSLVKNSSQTVEIKDKTNEKKPYLEQNISNHKLDRWDKKANTNTSPEMKISCNVEKGTSLVKNSSQTVEIKDKTNEKKPYLEQNISNHKLDRWDKKANTNTSPEMKISCNVKQGTSLVKNSSQTVEIKDKTNEKKPYLEQNISNHKLDRWDKKANTNTSPEMKISCNVEKGTSLVKNSSQTVEIKDKTNEKKPYLEQNISNHKLDRWDKKANTNTSPEMKISCNVEKGTSLVKNSSQTVEIKDKTNEKKPYLEQNISNHKLDRWDKKANTNTSPEMKISCNVEKGTSLVKNSSQTVEIKDKTNEKKPYLEQNISNHKLDRWDKKANTNTSPEMKISCNVKKALL